MRAHEFAAGWSEEQVAWEPQSRWLVSEEGGVSWKRCPQPVRPVLSPSGQCWDCTTLQSTKADPVGLVWAKLQPDHGPTVESEEDEGESCCPA